MCRRAIEQRVPDSDLRAKLTELAEESHRLEREATKAGKLQKLEKRKAVLEHVLSAKERDRLQKVNKNFWK